MDDSLVLWIVLIVGVVVFLVGRYLDVAYRVKLLRRLTKKNWHMIKMVGLDMKDIQTFALDIDKGVFRMGNNIWYALEGNIFREGKEEDGFKVKKKNVLHDEGVPTIFIYQDSMKPASFDRMDKSTIKPEEAGASLNGYIATEIEKDQAKQGKILLYVTLGLILALGAAALAYLSWQEGSKADAQSAVAVQNSQLIMDHFGIVAPTPNSTTNGSGVNSSGMLPTSKPGG